jgi:hypothetical protein
VPDQPNFGCPEWARNGEEVVLIHGIPLPDGGARVLTFGPFIIHRWPEGAELFFHGHRVRSISPEDGVLTIGEEDRPIDLSQLMPWPKERQFLLSEQLGITQAIERARAEFLA